MSFALAVVQLAAFIAWIFVKPHTWIKIAAITVVAVACSARFALSPDSTAKALVAGWFTCAAISELIEKQMVARHAVELAQARRDGARQEAYRYVAHLARIKRNRQGS